MGMLKMCYFLTHG